MPRFTLERAPRIEIEGGLAIAIAIAIANATRRGPHVNHEPPGQGP
jgi:hypothetical protein